MAVNKNDGTVTLAHEAIPGYMAAMTMDYPRQGKVGIRRAKPGQTSSDFGGRQRPSLAGRDRRERRGQGRKPIRLRPRNRSAMPLGQKCRTSRSINQDGKRIHFHQYHGKALLLTFIYTRCPLPDYCPLMSQNFAQILAQIATDPKLSPSTRLLSISIDPEYDKPAVLRAYALDVAGDPHPFDHWEFASGTPDQVRKVAEFFGLKYWKENGQIVHALVTALVGPDGKVAKVYRGNDWQPAEVLADLQAPGLRKITQ